MWKTGISRRLVGLADVMLKSHHPSHNGWNMRKKNWRGLAKKCTEFKRMAANDEDMTKTNSTTGTLEATRNSTKVAKDPQTATQKTPRNRTTLPLDHVHEPVETVSPLLTEILAYSNGVRHWGLND